MLKRVLLFGLWGFFGGVDPAQAGDHAHAGHHQQGHEHAGVAPVSIMGEHAHGAGEWMLSYRYGLMDMQGLRDGTRSVNPQAVFSEYAYPVAPLRMRMQMHMMSLMVAPSDALTVMLMLPYRVLSMDHRVVAGPKAGQEFTTDTRGIGDVSLSAVYELFEFGGGRVLLNLGLSLPTGSIDERGITPASQGVPTRLPYAMQLGSGTYDLLPGLTYTETAGRWDWGAQALAVLRSGENANAYALGNRYQLNAWAGRVLVGAWHGGVRIGAQHWRAIRGADSQLNAQLVPTADPARSGGTLWDAGLDVAFAIDHSQRLLAELSLPFYQRLEGPQLETDWRADVAWQYRF